MKEREEDVLRYIYTVSGKNRILILLMLIVEIVIGAINISYALFYKAVIDHAFGHNVDALLRSVISLLVLLALQISLYAVLRFFREYSASGLENAFKTRLYSCLLSGDYGQVSAVHSGEWMNRLTSDTKVIADSLSTVLPHLAGLITRMCGATVMLMVIDLRLGLILVFGGVVIAVLSSVFRKKLKEFHKLVQEEDGRLRMFLQEHLESLVIIKAYAMEEKSISGAENRMSDHRKVRMQRNAFSNICNTGFIAAMEGAYLFGFFFGAFGIYQGSITYGTLIAILELIGQIRTPFAHISGYLPKYYAMIASAERIMGAERITADRRAGNRRISCTGEKLKEIREFGFKDVSFSYFSEDKGETEVFSHLDLNVRKGEFVAFTGASGCGKTTALKLFLGLYPVKEGLLYIDTGEGRKEAGDELRQLFAYVPQGNCLMSGSIKDAVSYAAGDDYNLEKALDIACASGFVSELSSGMDTMLGERGSGLSEGQMQRIAIARAVCSDRPVLLLDEATSALDGETEKKLLTNLRSMTDKTVIIVTHRKAALSICDREIHFDGSSGDNDGGD